MCHILCLDIAWEAISREDSYRYMVMILMHVLYLEQDFRHLLRQEPGLLLQVLSVS